MPNAFGMTWLLYGSCDHDESSAGWTLQRLRATLIRHLSLFAGTKFMAPNGIAASNVHFPEVIRVLTAAPLFHAELNRYFS